VTRPYLVRNSKDIFMATEDAESAEAAIRQASPTCDLPVTELSAVKVTAAYVEDLLNEILALKDQLDAVRRIVAGTRTDG
jgi:hypothetical protein